MLPKPLYIFFQSKFAKWRNIYESLLFLSYLSIVNVFLWQCEILCSKYQIYIHPSKHKLLFGAFSNHAGEHDHQVFTDKYGVHVARVLLFWIHIHFSVQLITKTVDNRICNTNIYIKSEKWSQAFWALKFNSYIDILTRHEILSTL